MRGEFSLFSPIHPQKNLSLSPFTHPLSLQTCTTLPPFSLVLCLCLSPSVSLCGIILFPCLLTLVHQVRSDSCRVMAEEGRCVTLAYLDSDTDHSYGISYLPKLLSFPATSRVRIQACPNIMLAQTLYIPLTPEGSNCTSSHSAKGSLSSGSCGTQRPSSWHADIFWFLADCWFQLHFTGETLHG